MKALKLKHGYQESLDGIKTATTRDEMKLDVGDTFCFVHPDGAAYPDGTRANNKFVCLGVIGATLASLTKAGVWRIEGFETPEEYVYTVLRLYPNASMLTTFYCHIYIST